MTAIDDRWPEERFYFRSDHYNFARKGVPILFFFNGVHPDYHRVTDSPDKIDGEKESRILRLIYSWAARSATPPRVRRWNPESYRTIVDDPPGPDADGWVIYCPPWPIPSRISMPFAPG